MHFFLKAKLSSTTGMGKMPMLLAILFSAFLGALGVSAFALI